MPRSASLNYTKIGNARVILRKPILQIVQVQCIYIMLQRTGQADWYVVITVVFPCSK